MKCKPSGLKVISIQGRNNKTLPNQWIVVNNDNMTFHSYNYILAEYSNGILTVNNEAVTCSVTIEKYFSQFLEQFSQLAFLRNEMNHCKEDILRALNSKKKYTVIDFNDGILIYNKN